MNTKKGSIGRGMLIGASAGVALAGIIVLLEGGTDDLSRDIYEVMIVGGGIEGSVIGSFAGGTKREFIIAGKQENYQEFLAFLEKRGVAR